MTKMRFKYLIMLLVLLPFIGYGQDVAEVLKNVRNKYEQLNQYHAVMSIKVYDTNSNSVLFEQNAEVKRDGDNFLNRL